MAKLPRARPTFTVKAKPVWQVQCGGGIVALTAMKPYPRNVPTTRAAAAGDAYAAQRLREAPWLRGGPQTFIETGDDTVASRRILDRLVSAHPTRLVDGRDTYMTFAGTVDEIVGLMKRRRCRLLSRRVAR